MQAMTEHNHPDSERCGEKCGGYAEAMAVAPGMGARTWADAEAQESVMEQTEHIQHLTSQYNAIVQSIVGADVEPGERARLLTEAATGYAERVGESRNEGMHALKPGPIARLFGAKVTNSEGLGPDDYAVVPDPDKPATWKLRIDDPAHISGAIQALGPGGFRGQPVELDAGERAKALAKIRAAVNKIPAADRGNLGDRLHALKAIDEVAQPAIVRIYRDKDGAPDRFALWSSNQFRDREGEIVSEKALRAAIARFDGGNAGAQADVYHVAGSEWGRVDLVDYVDGFLMAAGRVTRPDVAAGIAAWGEKEELGTSIGYRYWDSDLVDGVYSDLEINRITVLPRNRAANPWGPQDAVRLGRREMGFDPAKRTAMVELFGDEQTKQFESEAEAEAGRLIKEGRDYKEFSFDIAALPRVRYVVEAAKDDASAADATPASAVGGDPVVPAAEAAPPAWATEILGKISDMQAAIGANQDQVKALKAEVEGLPPAAGVLGRSVQTAEGRAVYDRVIGAATKEAAEAERGTPIPGSVAGYDPGSAVAKAIGWAQNHNGSGDKAASH